METKRVMFIGPDLGDIGNVLSTGNAKDGKMGKALDAIGEGQSETMGLGFFLAVTLFPPTKSGGHDFNETNAEGCARTPANVDPDLEADRWFPSDNYS